MTGDPDAVEIGELFDKARKLAEGGGVTDTENVAAARHSAERNAERAEFYQGIKKYARWARGPHNQH
jgi:hypothetical protein